MNEGELDLDRQKGGGKRRNHVDDIPSIDLY